MLGLKLNHVSKRGHSCWYKTIHLYFSYKVCISFLCLFPYTAIQCIPKAYMVWSALFYFCHIIRIQRTVIYSYYPRLLLHWHWGNSNSAKNVSEANLMDMDQMGLYITSTKHKKLLTKCVFREMNCMFGFLGCFQPHWHMAGDPWWPLGLSIKEITQDLVL